MGDLWLYFMMFSFSFSLDSRIPGPTPIPTQLLVVVLLLAVHPLVHIMEERVHILQVEFAHADGHGNGTGTFSGGTADSQIPVDLLLQLLPAFLGAFLPDDHKFISAVADHSTGNLQGLLQNPRHLLQHFIAAQMTVSIIDYRWGIS